MPKRGTRRIHGLWRHRPEPLRVIACDIVIPKLVTLTRIVENGAVNGFTPGSG